MKNPLGWIDEALDELGARGLRRELSVREGGQSGEVELDGRKLINFGSNDYLALANDPRLAEAAAEVNSREGWGSGASPLVSGRGATLAALERRLAEFEECEAALVFPSGFAANSGTIPALVDQGDAVYGDAKNHASLIDGCRLARAERFIYQHGDVAVLRALLAQNVGRHRRRLIVTDTLFSMDGDLAPLGELAALAEEFDAMLMVDEAHATGVFGERGRGVVEHLAQHWQGLEQQVHVRVGTLSKALGSAGGFVAGSRSLIDWLANRARSYVFSTAQPAGLHAAALAALELVDREAFRREELLERAASLRDELRARGWNTGDSASQIIPIIVGEAARTMELARCLRERGFFVPGIRPPTVPEGESLLRISLCYHHTPEMIDGLIKKLGAAR